MPLPITTPLNVPFVCCTICWAAARVSKLTLFHVASRCSVIRRIFIFRPFLRVAKKKQIPLPHSRRRDDSVTATSQPESQRRPPKKTGGRYKFKNKGAGERRYKNQRAQARLPMPPK